MVRRGALALGLAAALTLPATAQDVAGRVKTLEGTATIISGGERIAAQVGSPVRSGDLVETGAGSAIGLSFRDDSTVALGANTALAIDEFVFAPAQERYGFTARMARGTAYFVSGGIARLAPDKVAVTTPVATIGIRGTRFLVKLDDE